MNEHQNKLFKHMSIKHKIIIWPIHILEYKSPLLIMNALFLKHNYINAFIIIMLRYYKSSIDNFEITLFVTSI
jgi:hypothetical protein